AASISFNYLGQWDNLGQGQTKETGLLSPSDQPLQGSEADDEPRPHLINVIGLVSGGRLQLEWAYSSQLHRHETVAAWAERYLDLLRELIVSSNSPGAQLVAAPTHFQLLDLTDEQVLSLAERVPGVVDAYPLTPLQQGMLFHTLSDPEEQPGAYFDQAIFDLEGTIDLAA